MNGYVKIGLVALAAYAAVAILQRKVMAVPMVGEYLPR
jgi:hypothetical protein